MMDQETSEALHMLIQRGKLGSGVFSTADCRKTYEELKAKGVEFSQPPTVSHAKPLSILASVWT